MWLPAMLQEVGGLRWHFRDKMCQLCQQRTVFGVLQEIRCLMSVSVDIPGHGHFDIPLTASSTAADIILLLRESLPDTPWHGNKLLSSGVCQLQCDDIVEETGHSTLVLTNYSEITNQETNLHCTLFF
eukprot:s2681_g4.t1